MKKKIKRYVTLIEMMIVMFLIALIIGIVAYNYSGAQDEGKAFKTKVGKEKLETILNLIITDNPEAEEQLESRWKDYIKSSPLVQNPNALVKDGWGQEYRIEIRDGRVKAYSQKYIEYIQKNPMSMHREDEDK